MGINHWVYVGCQRSLDIHKMQVGKTMLMNPRFTDITLSNRLGQEVHLGVCHIHHNSRDYVFVAAPTQQASSFVGKNAEPFAFQLRELFALDVRRFEMIEVREVGEAQQLYRWRFEWVGNSPLSARSEEINSIGQATVLFSLLNPATTAAVANA